MRSKLNYLRAQAAAYLRDADASYNEREAARLIMLAVRCQEQIYALEQDAAKSGTQPRADSLPSANLI